MDTEAGTIEIELFDAEAPGTVANFVKLAQAKFYDDFIKKVIDFILIISLTEFGWLKTLIYYIFWSQWHRLLLTSLIQNNGQTPRLP
mgnify:CR=1 FL=1